MRDFKSLVGDLFNLHGDLEPFRVNIPQAHLTQFDRLCTGLLMKWLGEAGSLPPEPGQDGHQETFASIASDHPSVVLKMQLLMLLDVPLVLSERQKKDNASLERVQAKFLHTLRKCFVALTRAFPSEPYVGDKGEDKLVFLGGGQIFEVDALYKQFKEMGSIQTGDGELLHSLDLIEIEEKLTARFRYPQYGVIREMHERAASGNPVDKQLAYLFYAHGREIKEPKVDRTTKPPTFDDADFFLHARAMQALIADIDAGRLRSPYGDSCPFLPYLRLRADYLSSMAYFLKCCKSATPPKVKEYQAAETKAYFANPGFDIYHPHALHLLKQVNEGLGEWSEHVKHRAVTGVIGRWGLSSDMRHDGRDAHVKGELGQIYSAKSFRPGSREG